ncbi:MAG TPA: cysteine desulfurase [Kofleriaceae bacterium]|nr:cysteine desulfurase [Kofleriaceae bacterium]
MSAVQPKTRPGFDVDAVRRDFPALQQLVYGKPLVYLDSAATALKPQAVIDAVTQVYARDCANIHRAVHLLSQRATSSYEGARDKLRDFLGAAAREEIIFLRGTTEAINLVAQSYARPRLQPGDEVLVSGLEHHSNIVPWQQVCEQTGARLVVVPIDDRGEPTLAAWGAHLSSRTRVVATAHISNALGTVQPVAEIARLAHQAGAVVVIDGAQAAPHMAVDVQALGADFYALSGHKLYGPSGAGVLWGRRELLDAMPPWQGGGDMIRSVTFARTTYAPLPHKFEAGTPDIAAVVGLGAAVDYVRAIGLPALEAHERDLLAYGTAALAEVPGLRLVGTAPHKAAVLSFTMDDIHPHDIGTIVDREGVAIRTGHHCAQPVMERFGLAATARASLGMYSSRADLDALVRSLHQVRKVFA